MLVVSGRSPAKTSSLLWFRVPFLFIDFDLFVGFGRAITPVRSGNEHVDEAEKESEEVWQSIPCV